MRNCVFVVILAACTPDEEIPVSDTDPSGGDGACGEVTQFDATLVGRVVDGAAAAGGASVRLEDRGWQPGTVLGTAVVDASGGFRLDATGVTSVEDCWGTLLDYVVVAEHGDKSGEKSVNSYLYGAYDQGGDADFSEFPITLE